MIEFTIELNTKQTEKARCIVRLKTSTWADGRGLHFKQSITFMRRQCRGFNPMEEDIGMVGAELVLPLIMNRNECDDGLYRVVTYDEDRNPETGCVEEYSYWLIPYDPATDE